MIGDNIDARKLKDVVNKCACLSLVMFGHSIIPIGSMYGIYANIWGILMVNVTIYGIHGSYGSY
jgi:hypothetical protein